MSADNYHYVGKTKDGKFGVWENLSASSEGPVRGKPDAVYDTAEEALVAAHKLYWTEYGVTVGEGVLT